MILNIKLYTATLLSVFLTLFSWSGTYLGGCYPLIFALVILLVISHSFIGLKMQERLCFKECFLKESSLFAKMLSSRIFTSLLYTLLSIAMSLSILALVIDFQPRLWIYLFTINIALILFLYKGFDHLLRNTINRSYRMLLAREWSIHIATIFFALFAIYTYYNGYEPPYLAATLKESMIHASSMVASECGIIDMLVKLHKESDALFWWVTIHGSQYIEYHPFKLVAWFAFFLLNSLALWGINRFIAQIIYILDQIFSKEER